MMTTDRSTSSAPVAGRGWGWLMAYGVISVVLAALAFAAPLTATFTTTVTIGAFLMVAGFVSIGLAIFGHAQEGRLYAGLFGLLSVVIGAMLAFQPAAGAVSLTLAIAVWLGVRGILEIVLGAKFRATRWLMIALGVVNLLLAALILATLPLSALTLPGYVLGLSFMFGGVNAIVAAAHHRKGAAAFGVPV